MQLRTEKVDGPISRFAGNATSVWISPDVNLIGFGEAHRFEVGLGSERFARTQTELERFWRQLDYDSPAMAIALASFTFDERSHGSIVIVPEVMAVNRDGRWSVTSIDGADPSRYLASTQSPTTPPNDRPRFAGSTVPDLLWLEAVAAAIEEIEQGLLEKVVLARDYNVWSKQPFDPSLLLLKLVGRFPECFTFLIDGLVGASPELLIRRNQNQIESLPLAGSAARSSDQVADKRLGRELLTSDKDMREHAMAAASVQTVFERICTTWDSQGPDLFTLANVHHLATRFWGVLADPASALELAGALHPTAAVGGTPTEAALEAIRRLEQMDRGRYAGPVGWIDANGDGEFAMALRCASITGARARLYAGGGIVAGSLPEEELEETRVKLRVMLDALEP